MAHWWRKSHHSAMLEEFAGNSLSETYQRKADHRQVSHQKHFTMKWPEVVAGAAAGCCVLLATALRSWVWEKPGEHLFSKHAGPRELNPFPFAVFLQHPLLTKLSIIPPADRGKPLKSPSPLLWAIKAKQARKAEFGPMRHNVATGICPKLCLSTESPSLMVQIKRCLLSTGFLTTIIASFTKHN